MKILLQKYWVALVTILIGVFPLAVFSYLTGSFWPSSRLHRPFLTSTSVIIGDSIFIPIFNYHLHKLIRANIDSARRHRLALLYVFLVILGISAWVSYLAHKAWANDQYTGFMDLTIGRLSLAGWWHLCFSALQGSLVIFFMIMWFIFSKRNINAFRTGLFGWLCLSFYLVIGFLSDIQRTQTLYKNSLSTYFSQMKWLRIAEFLLVILILALANKRLQSWKLNQTNSRA